MIGHGLPGPWTTSLALLILSACVVRGFAEDDAGGSASGSMSSGSADGGSGPPPGASDEAGPSGGDDPSDGDDPGDADSGNDTTSGPGSATGDPTFTTSATATMTGATTFTTTASDTGGSSQCPHGVLRNAPLPASISGHTDDGSSVFGGECLEFPSAGSELIYEFVPPKDGFFEFTTTSANMFADTVLYLLAGDCDGPQIACGDVTDPDGSIYTSNIARFLQVGQTVEVVVDGKLFQGTEFTLTVDEVVADCVDEVIGAAALPITMMGDTTGRPNRMTSMCFGESPDYSYEWTAPQTGTYQIDTIGSAPGHEDTVVYVIDGNDCSGRELACNDDIDLGNRDLDSKLEVDLVAGQVVTIFVDAWSGSITGPYVLNISRV